MAYVLIRKNAYYDSVTLMRITAKIVEVEGVKEASVCMGTELNKELLRDSGLACPDTEAATPNDLIIAFDAADSVKPEDLVQMVDELMVKKSKGGQSASATDVKPVSLKTGLTFMEGANLVVISVSGRYAYIEAKKALMAGLNVMLFSDNLTIEEEKDLKTYASANGLLVMGPDCGTSIINHKGLCFANEVNSGKIGIVGASGTGLQEITVLIDRYGGGISQAIGVGGRDLSREIGGIMMLDALEALKQDEDTEVIVLLSKKPAQEVAEKITAAAKDSGKPTVICFLGAAGEKGSCNLHFASNLEQTALKALELSGVKPELTEEDLSFTQACADSLRPEQKYVRALYCGGTLCSEAHHIFKDTLGSPAYSNTSKVAEEALDDSFKSKGHTFLDLGDDKFTVGKPHPMIDPSIRNARIIQEAKDSETAVLLLDFEIGYGSHEDPAGVALKAVKEAKEISPELVVLAYVCGTEKDLQGLQQQKDALKSAGVIIAESNAQAARIAAEVIRRKHA